MIYGINFGAPDIPQPLLRGIRPRRIKGITNRQHGTVAVLVGACDSEDEKRMMTMQASNRQQTTTNPLNLIESARSGDRLLRGNERQNSASV